MELRLTLLYLPLPSKQNHWIRHVSITNLKGLSPWPKNHIRRESEYRCSSELKVSLIIAIYYSFITTCTTTRMVIVGMTNFVWKAWFCCHVVTRCCCYKIICPYFSFSWKWFCIIILLTKVGIMSNRILYCPWPDMSAIQKFQELISDWSR